MASATGTTKRRLIGLGLGVAVLAGAVVVLSRPGPPERGVPVDRICAECTVWAVAQQHPKLLAEIDQALAEEGFQRQHLDCGGRRLGERWSQVQATEVAPFYCGLGPAPRKRSFIVDAANIYLNDRDEPFDPYTGARYGEVRKVEIGKPRWSWGNSEWRE